MASQKGVTTMRLIKTELGMDGQEPSVHVLAQKHQDEETVATGVLYPRPFNYR